MKYIILPALCLTLSASLFSQTLFTYGKKSVTKKEFVKAFEKNPSADTANRKKLLQDYLELYISYKLKVQAAYDENLNQTDQFTSDVENFKRDLAENAIANEANVNSLVQQAFARSATDIQLQQIFVPVAAGTDTSVAFAKINQAYSLLKTGTSFNNVVMQFAADTAARQSKGMIGYITVFTFPYEAENIVYALHPGGYSKPYRSRIGYHIFKDVSERPAAGNRKIQTILFATSPDASEAEKSTLKKEADSVYQLIAHGASFGDMQALFGSKKQLKNNTIEVSVGQYSPDFEEQVYTLQNEGDVSQVFATAYGYNIIKLIEKEPSVKDTADLTVKAAMQEKVASDDRLSVAKKNLQKTWLSKTGYRPAVFNNVNLWKFTDSALANGSASASATGITDNTVLFSFAKEKMTVADWMRFVQMNIQAGNRQQDYTQWMPQFVTYALTNYYKKHIEDFHPELKPQIDEFKEANLLFATMDKHVWSKASEDTSGLLAYYRQHKNNYTWAPGADAIVVSANNKQVANELAEKIKAEPANWRNWRGLVNSYGSLAQADSSRFENNQLPVKDMSALRAGYTTPPVAVSDGSSFTFYYITAVYKMPEPRSFDEARGLVINDYQQVVENKWLADLKKKYPVTVNETVFKSIR